MWTLHSVRHSINMSHKCEKVVYVLCHIDSRVHELHALFGVTFRFKSNCSVSLLLPFIIHPPYLTSGLNHGVNG